MSFAGYGAVFGNVDSYDDIIAPGAFTATLAEHKAAGTLPVMLWNHDSFAMPIGIWSEMEEDDHGLKISGQFLDTAAGRDAYTVAKAGAVAGLSIGYIVSGFEMQKVEGKTVRLITEVKLMEVSLVTFPANGLARVVDVKSQMENEDMKMQRKSIERLSAILGEASELLSKLADETVEEETAEEEVPAEEEGEAADDEGQNADPEDEAKYDHTAVEAVKSLSFKF